MSITFEVANAGTVEVPETCLCDDDARCHFCQGTGVFMTRESALPSLNVANESARKICGLLGRPFDYYGEIPVAEIPAVRRRALALLNRSGSVSNETEPARVEQGGVRTVVDNDGVTRITRGCTAIYQGYTDERLLAYLTRIDEVLGAAQDAGQPVYWG